MYLWIEFSRSVREALDEEVPKESILYRTSFLSEEQKESHLLANPASEYV